MNRLRKSWFWVVCGIWSAIFLFLVGALLFISWGLPKIPDRLQDMVLSPPITIYDRHDRIITQIGGRQIVPFDSISPHFIRAIVATEDRNFWEHHGVSHRGILYASLRNLTSGRRASGASSLTQQLIKNLFFSFEKTWTRKIREQLLAFQFESAYTKKDILEAYCNLIFFGSRAYGIEAAAQNYFAKHASQLTIGESALLAGIVNIPTRLNPYYNYEDAKSRQRLVLRRMESNGFLTASEVDSISGDSLTIQPMHTAAAPSAYFVDYVRNLIEERYGREVMAYGGLNVYTTMDVAFQTAAQEAVYEGLKELDGLMQLGGWDSLKTKTPDVFPQGALVAVDPTSGEVRALVGGRDFIRFPFNRAVANQRSPGSSFKPFVYYTALKAGGFSPASVLLDSQITIPMKYSKDWKPRAFGNKYLGRIVLKEALTHSVNTISAQLIMAVTPDEVVKTAKAFGIQSNVPANPSIALGSLGVSPFEMAAAYSTLANNGFRVEPFLIRKVEDRNGRDFEETVIRKTRVADPATVRQLVDMMEAVLDQGTGIGVRTRGFQRVAAGKTGTTNDYRDAWFVGYTPNVSAAVWVGLDNNQPLYRYANKKRQGKRGVTGGAGAAPVWVRFMKAIAPKLPLSDFPDPASLGLTRRFVSKRTGQVVSPDSDGVTVLLRSDQIEFSSNQDSVGHDADH